MKHSVHVRLTSFVLASCLLSLVQSGFALTCIWTGAGGNGDWNNQNNWSTHTVPVSGDKAYITNNATFAVAISNSVVFSTLTVGGVSGTVTVNWSGGWVTGKVMLGQNAVLNLVNAGNDHILSGVVTNYGRINWQQGGWTFDNGSRLENEPGALVDVQCDQTVDCTGSTNSVINNAGTFRKSAGTGETDISPTPSVALNNTSLIDVQKGTLALYGNGTNSGTINIAAGAIFAMNGGTYSFATNGSSLFTGAGVCEMGDCSVFGKLQGAITYRVTYDITFNTELVSGTLIWAYGSGNQYGPLTIDANATYNIGSSCNVAGAMTNWGTIVYPARSAMTSWSWNAPARLKNQPGAVIDLQSDLRFYYGSGHVPLENAGTLLKSGGIGTSIIDPGFSFTNTGTIRVQSGDLSLSGLTSSNAITIGAGATVSLDTGNFIFGPTNTISGPGVLALNVDAAPSAPAVIGPLNGTADFQMDADANFTNCILGGTLKWIGGTMGGILTVGTNGALVMINSGTTEGTLTNLGQVTFNPLGTNSGVVGGFSTLSVGGNYIQSSGAALDMGLGGRATDHFDQLDVTGTASLNGLLLVHLFNGFPPASSDTFPILSYASHSGNFSTQALPGGMKLTTGSTAAQLSVNGPITVQPLIMNPAISGGKMTFGVWTANGTNYTIYRTDSLKPANWVVSTTFTGDGNFWNFSLNMGSTSNRFYRVAQ